jgi:septum formation protein
MRLYLASTSPRRVELLRAAGIAFESIEPGDEPLGAGAPRELALLRARSKALGACTVGLVPGWVLGVDTVVGLGSAEFGKPADANEARRTLLRLSGTTHEVMTAHVLVAHPPRQGGAMEVLATSEVQFAALDFEQVDAYVASGEWQGRAGGYAIQGLAGRFARVVRGDFDTVVGLSLATVRELIASARRQQT